MGKPPVHSIVSPRAMLNIPSVATNGGSLNRVMTKPLNHPRAVPTSNPATIAPDVVNSMKMSVPGMVKPLFNKPAATAPANASTAPTDKSMPPDRMMIVMPMERQRLAQICRSTFRLLSTVKNLSVVNASASTINASASRD